MEHRPGVIPRQDIRELIARGNVAAQRAVPLTNLQPASLDLRLGSRAIRLRCSFLPGRQSIAEKLSQYQMGEVDLTSGAILELNRPYLIPLQESLELPRDVRGRANPRSSTGRIDVFTRLLTDFGQHFDEVPAGYSGPLYVEVIPLSFPVKVKTGLTLNQLRFIRGTPRVDDERLKEFHRGYPIVFPGRTVDPGESAWVADGMFLTVDLSGQGRKFVGYRARKNTDLLDLSRRGSYRVQDFWEKVEAASGRLILQPNDFYLLVSRERVRVPAVFASEMAAYDPTSGELRTHYAGFFDPGFGVIAGSPVQGTHAVLEVRAHDVPFALDHGQRLCKLTFETMSTEPDQVYGSDIGSRYQRQYLALGRQFRREKGDDVADEDLLRLFKDPMPLQSDSSGAAAEVAKALALRLRDEPMES